MKTLEPEPVDGLDTPAIATAALVSTIGTFVLIVSLQVLYAWLSSDRPAMGTDPARASAGVLAEQRAKMNRYGWLDRESNLAAIPIDRAVDLTLQDLHSDAAGRDRRSSAETEGHSGNDNSRPPAVSPPPAVQPSSRDSQEAPE